MKSIIKCSQTLRFARVIGIILEFFVVASSSQMMAIFRKDQGIRYRKKSELIQHYSRRVLQLLNVTPESFAPPSLNGGMMVCNHLSYLDILVISSQFRVLYITSVETGSSGWVGALCRLAGCLFVERRKVTQLKNELTEIDSVLGTGTPVVLFPEATSSDGRDVLPFRSSLYECAIQARVPIHVFCLRYDPVDSGIAYHGAMTLLPHLFQLCDGIPRKASLEFLDTTEPSDNLMRKSVAQNHHRRIRQAYVSRMGRHPEHHPRVGTPLCSSSV
jgi:1-acyl-sn-glycerol-3-phosphate acyltransferase